MNIEIARLLREEKDFEGEYPSSILGLSADSEGVTVEGPIRYSVTALLADSELVVTGLLEVDITCICSRCGVRFAMTVREGAFVANREIVDFTAHVDLTEEVREVILLAFPSYPLCRIDCRGLCAHCGVDLNKRACACRPDSDARWNGLDHLNLN